MQRLVLGRGRPAGRVRGRAHDHDRLHGRHPRVLWCAVPPRGPRPRAQLGVQHLRPRRGQRVRARAGPLVDGPLPGSPTPTTAPARPWAAGASGATCTRRASRPSGRRTWSRTRRWRRSPRVSRRRAGRPRPSAARSASTRSRRAAQPKRPRSSRRELDARRDLQAGRGGTASSTSSSSSTLPRRRASPKRAPSGPAAAEPRLCAPAGAAQVRQGVQRGPAGAQPRHAHRRARPRFQRVCARAARALAAQQLQEAAVTAKQRKASKACLSGQVRNLLARAHRVAVARRVLTKHFQTAKKGSDSFRPAPRASCTRSSAACTWPTARAPCLALDELAKHLPALRSQEARPPLRSSCRAASHRGICSIQRSLALDRRDDPGGGAARDAAAARRGEAGRVFEGDGVSKLMTDACVCVWCS